MDENSRMKSTEADCRLVETLMVAQLNLGLSEQEAFHAVKKNIRRIVKLPWDDMQYDAASGRVVVKPRSGED